MKQYLYLIVFIPVALAGWGLLQGGWYHFSTIFFVLISIPILDYVVGFNTSNPEKKMIDHLKADRFFDRVMYAYIPMHLLLIIGGAWYVSLAPLHLMEWIGVTLSIGLVSGGIGITFAHELGHRPQKFQQHLSQLLLAFVSYTHFFIEHNQGHHAKVTTPQDPATSRFGESFYQFFPRTVIGGFQSAWNIETKTLARKNLSRWHWKNRMIWYSILPFLIALLLGGVFSFSSFFFFFFQSFVAFTLLELVNYIEHYGLQRKEIVAGKYEKITPLHSWNCSAQVSNYLLINLQRHSDHHANAATPYPLLRHFEESPQLSFGYPTLISLALVPALWFKHMNPKVIQWQNLTQSS